VVVVVEAVVPEVEVRVFCFVSSNQRNDLQIYDFSTPI